MTTATIEKTLHTRKDWEVVKLGDVCEFIGGSQPEKSYFQRELLPDFVRLVQIQDFRRSDLKVYIPISEAKRSFDETDIMIGRYGPPVFQIFRGLSGAYNVALIKAAPNTLKLTKGYLFFLLKEPSIQNRVIAQSQRSAGQTGVDKAFLENIKIPLPPLAIQKEIADYLQFRLTRVEEAKQAVKAELEAAKALKQAYLREVFSSEQSKNWGKVKLGDMCENLDSKRVPITSNVRNKGNIPYYGASGVVDYVEDYIFDEDLLLVSEDGANLISRTQPIAFSISGKTWINNHAHVLKFESRITQQFVEFYINYADINIFVSGSAQPKLNQENLNKIPIPLPPLAIQKEIADYLQTKFTTVDTLVLALTEKKRAIDDLPQAFLREVFGDDKEE